MNIRLSLSDIKAFDREDTAIALPDGSGYVGTLNVFHEIHCVVSVVLELGSVCLFLSRNWFELN